MSKLIQALQSSIKTATAPIGFNISGKEPTRPPIFTLATINGQESKKTLKGLNSNTVDGVIVHNHSTVSFADIQQLITAIPLGYMSSSDDVVESNVSLESGCDFFIYTPTIPVALLKNVKVGKIVRVDSSVDAGILRAINELRQLVDAVLLADQPATLTFKRLVISQRLADILSIPLLVTVDPSICRDEIIALCEVGISAIVLPEKCTIAQYTDIHSLITGLPGNIKRKGKNNVIIPRIDHQDTTTEDDEQEEEVDE